MKIDTVPSIKAFLTSDVFPVHTKAAAQFEIITLNQYSASIQPT